jgi:hypothetical protein
MGMQKMESLKKAIKRASRLIRPIEGGSVALACASLPTTLWRADSPYRPIDVEAANERNHPLMGGKKDAYDVEAARSENSTRSLVSHSS